MEQLKILEVPKCPKEYKSGIIRHQAKGNSQTIHDEGLTVEVWTEAEEQWAWDLHKQGYTYKEIAESLDRGNTSVSIKMKRLKKRYGLYNEKHKDEKYKLNAEFIKFINPININSILDVYGGVTPYYSRLNVREYITNDINPKAPTTHHIDAQQLLNEMVEQGRQFDLVDVDPFGSVIQNVDSALKVCKKYLILTFGELGHKRWKRLDFIAKHYPNIKTIDDITIDNMIDEVRGHALKQGKRLKLIYKAEWQNIGRAYFIVE